MRRKIGCSILLLSMLSTFSMASNNIDEKKNKIAQINKQVSINKGIIKDNRNKIDSAKKTESQLKKEINYLSYKINGLQKEYNQLEHKYKNLQRNLGINENEIRNSIQKIKESNDNIDYSEQQYANRVIALDRIRKARLIKNTFGFESTVQTKRKQDSKKILDLLEANIESIKYYKKTVETNKKNVEKIKEKNLNEMYRVKKASRDLINKRNELNSAISLKDKKAKDLIDLQNKLGSQNRKITRSNIQLIREKLKLESEIKRLISDAEKKQKEQKMIIIKGTGVLKMPIKGSVVTVFKQEKVEGIKSNGIEIRGFYGQDVTAADTGTVIHVGQLGSLGGIVIINHGKLITVYGNLDTLSVSKGQNVKKGQKIGTLGYDSATNKANLYFETRKGVNFVDPLNYL